MFVCPCCGTPLKDNEFYETKVYLVQVGEANDTIVDIGDASPVDGKELTRFPKYSCSSCGCDFDEFDIKEDANLRHILRKIEKDYNMEDGELDHYFGGDDE